MKFKDFLKNKKPLDEFVNNRLKGATDIANKAKSNGGDALLTYEHFNAKLPIYRKLKNMSNSKKYCLDLANSKINRLNLKKLSQIEFQKLMGEIEVLGEIYLYEENNS